MKLTVIGIGTWGTALAIHLQKNGHEVCLYGRVEDNTEMIRETKSHPFLPGINIPSEIDITTNLAEAVENEYLVIAVRNHYHNTDDFKSIFQFLETLYISGRLQLPLKGIVLIGY